MKKMLMLGAALLTMQALPALAEDSAKSPDGQKKPRAERMFEEQDTNKDGAISAEEAATHAKKRFEEVDTDKDGKVTKGEAKAHHEAMRKKWKQRKEEMRAKLGKEKPADASKEKPADAPKEDPAH